jgi:hypothetical protein
MMSMETTEQMDIVPEERYAELAAAAGEAMRKFEPDTRDARSEEKDK